MNKLNLKITQTAIKDMETIADYIALDNKNAAIKMLKSFEKSFNSLCSHPNLGKKRKDFTHKDVLFFVIKKRYLIIYNFDTDNLVILRVLTTYMDICPML